MKLIVGLGNPGRSYANNRHNIGFICLSHFAKVHAIKFDKKEGRARTGTGEVAGEKLILAKPQTFMNSSGESVSRLVHKYNVNLDDLLVIHDDLDLKLGKTRIRRGGSAGGHKGVGSIITSLGSQDFVRLRIGIGRPPISEPTEEDIINYVLNDFTPEEREVIDKIVPRVSEAMLTIITEGLTVAMNKFN